MNKIKKLILLIIICCSLFLSFGCITENPQEKNDFTSEKLASSLSRLKQRIDASDNSENVELEIKQDFEKLREEIINMSMTEYYIFCEDYEYLNFRKYDFISYEETICIVLKYSNVPGKIEDVKIFEVPNEKLNEVENIKVGMDIFQVIEKMGYPHLVVLTSYKMLEFKLENGKFFRVFLDDNYEVLEVKYWEYETFSNSTCVVDERCDPYAEGVELSKAALITERMLFEEIVELIGKPYTSWGSGAIWYLWKLEDGRILGIHFEDYEQGVGVSLEVVRVVYE